MKYSSKSFLPVIGALIVTALAVYVGGGESSLVATPRDEVSPNLTRNPILAMNDLGSTGGGRAKVATTLLEEFKNALTAEEKVRLARELNQAYFQTRSASDRRMISDTISDYLKIETSPEAARALALSQSRMYFDENTLPNLKDAYDRKALSFDDYYGELAHIFLGIKDNSVREGVIDEIARSHNRYAIDIVSDMLSAENNITLSDKEKLDLQKFLKINEPIFTGAADSFGYFDSIRYENWLVANSRINTDSSPFGAEQFIAAKLLDPKTDPRALVAFALSPYAKSLTPEQQAAVQWDTIRARAQDYIRKHPNASALQQLGQPLLGM